MNGARELATERRKYLLESVATGAKWGGAVVGFAITVFTVDSFLPQVDLTPLTAGAFVWAPLVAFLGGCYLGLLRQGLTVSEHLRSQTEASPSNLVDLSRAYPELAAKIQHVDWDRLENDERAFFYNQYLRLNPRPHAGWALAAPLSRQQALQAVNPIDFQLLDRLLSSFGQHHQISLPMDDREFQLLRLSHGSIVDRVAENAQGPLRPDQADLFRKAYGVLSCQDLIPSEDDRRTLDVLLVPGARWSLQQRVDFAVIQQKLSGAHIILAGGFPPYHTPDAPPIAEAEAMFYYLASKEHGSVPAARVHLEPRASSSMEALRNSLPVLNKIAMERQRALRLGLVTSSYHMRRFLLQGMEAFKEYPHVVDRLVCLVVPATLDIDAILDGRGVDASRRTAVVRTFISEYLKLLAGRVVGEF